MTDLLVLNIEPASPSMIRSLDRHCVHREPDGASNIDPSRSDQNVIIIGHEDGLLASINDFYTTGPKPPAPPAKQSEKPYLRIVVSASPSYFRPDDPDAIGTWDHGRLSSWIAATMGQLRQEHGDDLVFAELHLDEDTPHIHAVVAPTYKKKPRVPGRRKRDEPEETFFARQLAAIEADGVRTVGRSSHPDLSKKGSFQRLRERMAVAVEPLGIDYGEDRSIDAPAPLSTREWVKQEAARLRSERHDLAVERADFLASQDAEKRQIIEAAEADAHVIRAAATTDADQIRAEAEKDAVGLKQAAQETGWAEGYEKFRAVLDQYRNAAAAAVERVRSYGNKMRAMMGDRRLSPEVRENATPLAAEAFDLAAELDERLIAADPSSTPPVDDAAEDPRPGF